MDSKKLVKVIVVNRKQKIAPMVVRILKEFGLLNLNLYTLWTQKIRLIVNQLQTKYGPKNHVKPTVSSGMVQLEQHVLLLLQNLIENVIVETISNSNVQRTSLKHQVKRILTVNDEKKL